MQANHSVLPKETVLAGSDANDAVTRAQSTFSAVLTQVKSVEVLIALLATGTLS